MNKTVWAKNLVFVGLCLMGVGAVSAGLLRRDWVEDPVSLASVIRKDGDFERVLAEVNAEFDDYRKTHQLEAAGPADDLTIARRLSLALCGTVPSLEEVRALENQPPSRRMDWWLARLLEGRRSSDYVAERMARTYVGVENGPFVIYRRRRFVIWLSDQFHQNQPYDDLVRSLISDRGLWTDSPAVNFLTVTMTEDMEGERKPDPIRLAGRTTRAFLGMRIDCLQCHDDRLGNIMLGTSDEPRDGRQSDFHKLAAYFSEAQSSMLGIRDGKGEYEYEYLDAEDSKVIRPRPPFSAEILQRAPTRREQLAAWVTHPDNEPFARATVNRFWALLFGRPLVEPVDDIPLHGPFPPAMESLADDFVSHGYDVHRLIRLIAATDVFRRDSRADFEVTAQHERYWAVFPLTRLRPEQVAGGLIQACSLRTINADSHILAQMMRFAQQNDFIQRYGDTGEDEFDDRAGTITQRLLMMNGDLVQERTKENPVANASTRIATVAPTDAKAVETTYLCVLSRLPTAGEREHFIGRLKDTRDGSRRQALEDLFWVLLNSSEFSWNH